MHMFKHDSKGFTLIATLLLLLMMSGIAIGMLMMVNTEVKVGTQDLQNNSTFHASEGAIEQMTANLANMFHNIQAPTASQIAALSALAPSNTSAITYPVYTLTATTDAAGNLVSSYGQVVAGQNGGLYAQILPVTLEATAQGPLGDEVNMSRTVEVALIPVFQFGIFSDSDLSFFAGPNFTFGGRVHTNGDLYLAEGGGSTLTFGDKLSAYGNVVRQLLPNGNTLAGNGSTGNVLIPTAASGCAGAQPHCRAMDATEGSVILGPTSAYNDGSADVSGLSWQTLSLTNYAGYIIDGDNGNTAFGTGATLLNLPFVTGVTGTPTGPQQYEIIRQPPAGESATSPLGASRLYNLAQIHVLLADNPNELPGGAADTNNVRLANINDADNTVDYSHGVPQTSMAKFADGGYPAMYFATANSAIPNSSSTNYWTAASASVPVDWEFGPLYQLPVTTTLHDTDTTHAQSLAPYLFVDGSGNNAATTAAPQPDPLVLCNPSTVTTNTTKTPPYCPDAGSYPYFSEFGFAPATVASDPALTLPFIGSAVAGTSAVTVATAATTSWNLLDGYLRVEYKDVNGNWNPVTQEWLALGFGRGLTPPTAPGTNPVNPNAILLLQKPADRNNDGVLDQVGAPPSVTCTATKSSGASTTCGNAQAKNFTYTPAPGKPPEVIVDPMSGSPWYGDSTLAAAGKQSPSQFNWYPINFYDPREGEIRDNAAGTATSCTPVGVMNAVEIDVGNLKRWLLGNIGATGNKVDYQVQNGYVLYFSDRRGMLPSPNGTQVDAANTKTGDSGFEDVINSGNALGTPNNSLEADAPGKAFSPEDSNLNGKLDSFGAANLGLGFGYNNAGFPAAPIPGGTAFTTANQINKVVNATAPPDPYMTASASRITSCGVVAQKNWVSGARHVLKLVDGSLGNVPIRPDNAKGGFTVGSENPVYVQGDYNSNAGDAAWGGGADAAGMAAASVIADTVTLLSDNWRDWNSIFSNPTSMATRGAGTSYYRMAIAAGKNINFPQPGGGWAHADYGTDGGMHNFLRYIENWGCCTLNYKGSVVSLFYSNYNTGVFKCCTVVYSPPTRNYSFDADFANPSGLPPGTPLFRDIDNLSYRQNLTACTVDTSTGVCLN
ncbi:MAG: hypothetical protein WB952_19955 [Terriglobales bacterium]